MLSLIARDLAVCVSVYNKLSNLKSVRHYKQREVRSILHPTLCILNNIFTKNLSYFINSFIFTVEFRRSLTNFGHGSISIDSLLPKAYCTSAWGSELKSENVRLFEIWLKSFSFFALFIGSEPNHRSIH